MRPGRLVISAVVAISLLWAQVYPSWADSISDAAARGQAAASSAMPNTGNLIGTDGAGNAVLNPGTGNQVTLAPNAIVPGTGAVSAATLSAAGTTYSGRVAVGTTAQSSLSGGSDSASSAYAALLASFNRSTPNLRNDPVFATTRSVINQIAANSQLFGSCTTTRVYNTSTTTRHVPDYQQCDRHMMVSHSETLYHSYGSQTMNVSVTGPSSVSSCGTGCYQIILGYVNWWQYIPKAAGGVFTETGNVLIDHLEFITSATLIQVNYDDWMRFSLGGNKLYDDWPAGCGVFKCDRGTHWTHNLSTDVTGILRGGSSTSWSVQVDAFGSGGGWAILQVHFTGSGVSSDTWSSAADTATAISDLARSTCSSTVSCAAMPGLDANGCTSTGGGTVCPADFTSPTTQTLAAYVNPLCTQVQVNTSCNASAGQMACYTDYQGNQQCYYNSGSNADNCVGLRSNASCSYVSTECIATDPGSGACQVAVDTFDCGQDVAVPGTTTATDTVVCTGPIRCMGTDCTSTTQESNANFVEVAAKLQAAQMMEQDGSCAIATDPTTCSVFSGTGGKCKVAVGGYINCCNKAVNVSLADYLHLMFSVMSVNSAIMKLPSDSVVRGSWEMIQAPIDQMGTVVDSAWQEAQASFTSAANSLYTNVVPNGGELFTTAAGPADGTAPGVISGITTQLTNSLGQWTYNLFGEQAANAIFSVAPVQGVGGGGLAFQGGTMAGDLQIGGGAAMIGTALVWVGAAYAIYSIVTTLLHIIFACESSEYQLDATRQLKECHSLGSYCANNILGLCIERKEAYCCFNTPLARILQEQVRGQLGISWGSAKSPSCGGLTTAVLNATDWSRVDLSEWIAMLAQSGMLSNVTNLTADSLTGSGNTLAAGGSRIDAVTRSNARLSGTDLSTTMDNATTQLRSLTGPITP